MVAIVTELRKLGATVEEGRDYCVITPPAQVSVGRCRYRGFLEQGGGGGWGGVLTCLGLLYLLSPRGQCEGVVYEDRTSMPATVAAPFALHLHPVLSEHNKMSQNVLDWMMTKCPGLDDDTPDSLQLALLHRSSPMWPLTHMTTTAWLWPSHLCHVEVSLSSSTTQGALARPSLHTSRSSNLLHSIDLFIQQALHILAHVLPASCWGFCDGCGRGDGTGEGVCLVYAVKRAQGNELGQHWIKQARSS
jgi:hypothetical protein